MRVEWVGKRWGCWMGGGKEEFRRESSYLRGEGVEFGRTMAEGGVDQEESWSE
jgi:hypothetical protein